MSKRTYEPSMERGVAVAYYLLRQVEVKGSIGCTPDELLDLAYVVLDEHGDGSLLLDALKAQQPVPPEEMTE